MSPEATGPSTPVPASLSDLPVPQQILVLAGVLRRVSMQVIGNARVAHHLAMAARHLGSAEAIILRQSPAGIMLPGNGHAGPK